MTSPLIRTWLAARLPDWVDHAYACWRGLTHSLGISPEWDPCQIDTRYLLDVPVPAGAAVVAGTQPGAAVTPPGLPSPALNLVLPCPSCGAHANAPCVNRFGETTGPHKARRAAAAAAADLKGAS